MMDRQLKSWKLAVDRFWSATAPDYREAARVVAEIAASGAEPSLRQAAAQALPSLRNAMLKTSDRGARDLARRRLSFVRDALHVLTTPRFGKRGTAPVLTPQEHYRQMLGLPLGRRLAAAEIHQAYKRSAKTAHPDCGGNGQEFRELSAARDALMKER
jgi:hypothetical protein